MDKHNHLVRQIVEEMAGSLTHMGPIEREKIMSEAVKHARIAVKYMHNAIHGYVVNCAAVPADKSYTPAQYLFDQGIIPAPEGPAPYSSPKPQTNAGTE